MSSKYDEDIWNYETEPEGCSACGNPSWPDCIDCCSLCDD